MAATANDEPDQGHTTAKSSVDIAALSATLLCFVITFFLMAPTLRIPFYLSDDSFLIDKALKLLDKIAEGHWLAAFTDNPGEARYFPGFFYYQALRIELLGLHAIAWHLFQALLYSGIGLLTTWVGHQLTRSPWPGLIAYVLIISTGELLSSSNWFNLITISTFEPPLTFLWLLTAYLLTKAFRSKENVIVSLVYMAASLMAIAWAAAFKETSFLILGASLGVSALYIGFTSKLQRDLKSSLKWLAYIVILLISLAIWGGFVYTRLPRNSGYAGVESLRISPGSIWEGLNNYWSLLIRQSDYLIPGGFLLLIIRLISNRKMLTAVDGWLIVVLLSGFFQLLTLAIWPYTEGRYAQPAYLCFLLVACCEYWQFFRKFDVLLWRKFALAGLITIGVLVAILVVISSAVSPPGLESFLRWYALVVGGLSAVYLSGNFKNIGSLRCVAQTCFAVVVLHIAVVVLVQSSIMRGFIFTEYECRQGIRHQIVRTVAALAPHNAAVYWVVNPDNSGHAWSADMNLDIVWERGDLIVGPSHWVATQRKTPKRGDILIDYTLNQNFLMDGQGQLSRIQLTTGGPTFWLKNTTDMRSLLTRLLFYPSTVLKSDLEAGYQSAVAYVYQVQSPTWEPDTNVRNQYFSNQ